MARLLIGSRFRSFFDRSSFARHVLWAFEASLFALFFLISRILSPDRGSAMGRRLLGWLGPRHPKNRHFRRNFSLAFPDRSAAQIEALAQAAWGGAGALLAEYAHLGAICARGPDERLEVVTVGAAESLRNLGRPAIFVVAHLANWELAATGIVRLGLPVTGVYTPLQNPYLEKILARARRPLGCRLVPRDESVRPILQELKEGRSVGLVMDQRVDSGKPVPMFGIDKLTTLVPARLALRHGCPLVPLQTERVGGARFRVTFYPPVRPDDESASEIEQAMQMTRVVNSMFENWIRARPEDWFCAKRRWPKDVVPAVAETAATAHN